MFAQKSNYYTFIKSKDNQKIAFIKSWAYKINKGKTTLLQIDEISGENWCRKLEALIPKYIQNVKI
jgi:hypothetical protein